MRVMIFIELADEAHLDGEPLTQSSLGEALAAWIGEHVTTPPEGTMAAEYNQTMAANAAMQEALRDIIESDSHGHAVHRARKVLGFIK